ncbi:hypothetical protein CVT24_013344 [Panaeolus cyanescens]|uniref:BTB domain-containing protein n=1 Tax=Panaeolus cyanescens TaxID=181874 RepID=A0A409YMF0_9AGAR|nr:hypothetical protein CVT24_013344 [Panaeolus cyanescens]
MPLPSTNPKANVAPGSSDREADILAETQSYDHGIILQHQNSSTSTLIRRHQEERDAGNSQTPRASRFSDRRSPSPSMRFSSMSISDRINSQDFRMSTLSTLTIGQYQTCHPTFWFSDGSIVLAVQSTLFKVHKSTLATHSETFADMFNVGQPLIDGQVQGDQNNDEWFDGCRIVKLFDDSVDDWIDLLGAIYQPNHFDDVPSRQFQIRHSSSISTLHSDNPTPTSQKPFNLSAALAFTSGILRLSHKYLIPHLRSRCLSLLAPFFPTTFEDFTVSMPLLNPQFPSSTPSLSNKKRDRDSGPLMTRTSTLLRAINLFHAVDVPQFLPYAYYCLSKLPSKRILHTRDLDPSMSERGELSWREKAMILHGKEQLRLAAAKDTMSCLSGFRRAVGCSSEYEEDGLIQSPMYSHHVALKECDHAARGAWNALLRGDFGSGCSPDTVRGGATAAANAAWASTASLITLNLSATSHASTYAPPVASTSSTGASTTTTTPGALSSLNFPMSTPESIHLTDPLAPFLSWGLLGPPSHSPYPTPHRSYTYPSHSSSSQSSYNYASHLYPSYKTSGEAAMCHVCLNECQIQHYEARRRVWEALPEMFGLGTWEELRRRGTI